MEIYQLREPRYNSPAHCGRPFVLAPNSTVGLPGMKCPVCGTIWTTTHGRISRDLPPGHFLYGMSPGPVAPDKIAAIAASVREVLNLPLEVMLTAGTDVCVLRLVCEEPRVPAFQWPKVHDIVIPGAVEAVLRQTGITGWHTEPVIVVNRQQFPRLPELKLLVIDGKGGTPLNQPAFKVTSRCDACGRVRYFRPVLESFALNESEWDGSDMFRFNAPFDGFVFINARVKQVLEEFGLDNYELQTTEEFMRSYQ